jgi:hypothetical protein
MQLNPQHITGPSSELRPQQNNEYVSPMILQYMETPQESYQNDMQQSQSHHSNNSHYHHLGSNSAPANIAFQTTSVPLSSGELDFDISPLTSPWLGAHQHSSHPRQTNKRTASPSGDEGSSMPSRKRQSPAIRPSIPMQSMKKSSRTSRSTNSTPLLRSTRSRRNSTVMEGDTPSPVDLSMPPPAPPNHPASSTSLNGALQNHVPKSPDLQLTPVTPASIMNLERLGLNSGLTHAAQDPTVAKQDGKGRSAAKSKAAGDSTGTRKTTRKGSGLPITSPSLKAILPGEKNFPLPNARC